MGKKSNNVVGERMEGRRELKCWFVARGEEREGKGRERKSRERRGRGNEQMYMF